jgi:hypothetical protein
MSYRKLLAGGAVALGLTLFASTVAAHALGDFACQTFSPIKTSAPATHCVTWTREAGAQMRAACDPQATPLAVMRERCAELSAGAPRSAG